MFTVFKVCRKKDSNLSKIIDKSPRALQVCSANCHTCI